MSLNTGRYRDQWHTMTRTGLSPTLSRHRREPLVEINPNDAHAYGLSDGGLARISGLHGEAVYRVSLCDGQAAGTVFVPMHWTDIMAGEGLANRLPGQVADPHSGQPAFKNVPATLSPVLPEWRAFLISREPVQADAIYQVRSRIEGGWLTELAGMGSVDIEALLPQGRSSEVADITRGMLRSLVQDEAGRLLAMLFVTRTGELPPREWVVREFANRQALSAELLAGRPSTPLPDRGPVVCVCHDVGESAILSAICDGASSVAAVGDMTCAGTNCGSCRPLIRKLLDSADLSLKEAAE